MSIHKLKKSVYSNMEKLLTMALECLKNSGYTLKKEQETLIMQCFRDGYKKQNKEDDEEFDLSVDWSKYQN